MPHSSGGGSSGGGFHGGSHSSSGSRSASRRYSSRPFPGALCYVYYDSAFRPRLLYADSKPEQSKKASIFVYIICAIMFLIPFLLIFVTSYHAPSKLNTNYDTTIVIRDDNEVLSDEEEQSLNNKFIEFFDITGITPSLITVDYSKLTTYASLEDYAYDSYIHAFKDEKHWLIVYSSKEGTSKENWAFEGMQGNDTDPILYEEVTTKFNNTLYDALREPDTSISNALIRAFDKITPHILDKTFIINWMMVVISAIWAFFVILFLVTQIITDRRRKCLANAIQLEGEAILKECPYCGTQYYAKTIEKCPKCGALVDYPHIPDVNKE